MKKVSAKKRRLFSLLLAIVMMFTTMPTNIIAVSSVSENEDGYVEIRTVEDLYNVRNNLTANYILMNDIDLTEATAAGGDWDFMGNGWNPIGSGDIYGSGAFSGDFDGNGHKITGMRIELLSLPSGVGSYIYLGLFANVTGSVHDLTLEDGYISSRYSTSKVEYIGNIAAKSSGTITNVHNSNVINPTSSTAVGTAYVGGIVGHNEGTISLSDNSGKIFIYSSDESSYVGGISGSNISKISLCYNIGAIRVSVSSSSYTYYPKIGGIAGYSSGASSKYSEITNCYNTGDLKLTTSSGSTDLGGYKCGITYCGNDYSRIKYCYNIGNCSYGISYNYGTSSVSNSYYLANGASNTTGATSLTEAQMVLSSIYVGFDFENVWIQNNEAEYPYPQLKNNPQDTRVIEGITLSSLPHKTEYEYGEPLDLTGAEITVSIKGGEEQVIVVTSAMVSGYDSLVPGTQNITVKYKNRTLSFDVIVKDKYYIPIYTIEDLYNVRSNLTGSYILMNDIDLTEATAVGGDWDFMGNGWNPIGSGDIYGNGAFSGEFDGNGHKITGMRIDVKTLPAGVGTNVYVGLFANVTGTVKNLTLTGGKVNYVNSKSFYVGSVAGTVNGIIDNCHNTMNISGKASSTSADYGHVGGIAGSAGDKALISICSNIGSVTAECCVTSNSAIRGDYCYAAGVVGTSTSNTVITKCYNTGDVKSTSYHYMYDSNAYTYGISNNGKTIDCYNSGVISATGTGYNCAYGIGGTATRCYNVGAVTGSGAKYAIAPSTSTNCYYLDGVGTSNDGSTALTETQMRLKSMYAGFDFENVWILNEFANHPNPQLRNNIQDLNESASIVSIISWPLKQVYYTNEELVLDGCMINVTYVSGKTELLSVTPEMISGFDNTKTGEQTVTVTYRGGTDTFPVTVTARPVVTKITLTSQPTKKEFQVGTAFDFAGAKLTVKYDDGREDEVDITVDMTTGGNINHLGEQTITVSFYGQTATFKVKVVPVSIASLRLDSAPDKLVYIEKQALDLTGMKLTAVMNNGTENEVGAGYTVSGYSDLPGTHTVTVSYRGKTVSFEVTVNSRKVVSLELKSTPDKKEYIVGQAFDPNGMMIVATYDNEEISVVENYEISGFDNVPGLKNIVISYGGKYVSFPITIIARVITDFKITSYPTKLKYLQYDVFDSTGLEVKATYNDGLTEAVTNYELVGFSSNPGTHTISVVYDGWVETFEITVSERVLTNIKVVPPTKLTYYIGENFDATGLAVTACYNNGQEVLVDDYQVSGFDSSASGAKTITVTYGGITRDFAVVISERSIIETGGSIIVGNVIGRLGETVNVPVTATKNTGVAGFKHTIKYDATALKFVSATTAGEFANGTIVVNDEKASNGEITILWYGATNVSESGVIYDLAFEILETATDGNTEIKIEYKENDIGNISGENVKFDKVDGYVEVRSYWLGDLNGDRKYAMVDLVMLAQYVAGFDMTLTNKQELSADVNEDGSIDIHDVILLNQWLLAENF